MRSLKVRASTSAGPAAGNGTIIVTGRVGNACAAALRDEAGKEAAAAARCRNRRRGRFMVFLLRNRRRDRRSRRAVHSGVMPFASMNFVQFLISFSSLV